MKDLPTPKSDLLPKPTCQPPGHDRGVPSPPSLAEDAQRGRPPSPAFQPHRWLGKQDFRWKKSNSRIQGAAGAEGGSQPGLQIQCPGRSGVGRELCRAGSSEFLSLLGTHQGSGTKQSCRERGEHPLRPGPEPSTVPPAPESSAPNTAPERWLGWRPMGTCRDRGHRCVSPPGCRACPVPSPERGSSTAEGTMCSAGSPTWCQHQLVLGR